jgi:hypothetical protein
MSGVVDSFGNGRVPDPTYTGSGGFNAYAAGRKHYGGGRHAPNIGPVQNLLGYAVRDNKRSAMQNAILARMKSQDKGNPMAFPYLNYLGGGSS